ncbi:helix-turn-helix domain-containing protein [Phaeospirillum tilakii]|uniref:Helix-turn-helix domain-containing protein n=1 Tax=Phaeospirillum tilakii TaxID=741673 RepID=A0ABW5CDR4_9PROT
MSNTRLSSHGRTRSGRPNPIDVHVGERLRLRRMLLGLSQEALAGQLGLTFQQIQKYESGTNRIGASRLYDLARVLEVAVDYFYEEMPPQVSAASPRHLTRAEIDPDLPASVPLNSREALDLIRTYYRIPDPRVRRRVSELARALGPQDEGDLTRGADVVPPARPDPGE